MVGKKIQKKVVAVLNFRGKGNGGLEVNVFGCMQMKKKQENERTGKKLHNYTEATKATSIFTPQKFAEHGIIRNLFQVPICF